MLALQKQRNLTLRRSKKSYLHLKQATAGIGRGYNAHAHTRNGNMEANEGGTY